jgi:hypothetical protein
MFRPVSGHRQVDVQSYKEKIISGWGISFSKAKYCSYVKAVIPITESYYDNKQQ